jgi:hypothetical protein
MFADLTSSPTCVLNIYLTLSLKHQNDRWFCGTENMRWNKAEKQVVLTAKTETGECGISNVTYSRFQHILT